VRSVDEIKSIRAEQETQYAFANIIGQTKVMQDVFELVRRVARTNASILIQGESGTG
jgi:two-component system NtrC family response regulator